MIPVCVIPSPTLFNQNHELHIEQQFVFIAFSLFLNNDNRVGNDNLKLFAR